MSISNITAEIVTDITTIETILIHASAERRTKQELREDLDKISDLVDKIKGNIM